MFGDFKETSWGIIKAVIPIAAIVLALQITILGTPAYMIVKFLIGAFMVAAGLILFMFGLKISILPIGEAIGSHLPQIGSLPIILMWSFFLGFTATLAEPPVRVLAIFIETTSSGEINANLIIIIASLGIGIFIAAAILRIALQIPLSYFFLGGYTVILILSFFIPPEFVTIAFDTSGVTTGPVTVPVILSLGIGVTSVLGGKSTIGESFGMVGLASIGPILAVMIAGVLMK